MNNTKNILTLLCVAMLTVLMTTSAFALDIDLLSTDPAPIVAGEYAELTVSFATESNQNDRSNIEVSLEESNYISVITNAKTYNQLRSGGQITTTFTIFVNENTPEGYIPITAVFKSNQGTETQNLEIYVDETKEDADLVIGDISSTPEYLLPDTTYNEITVTLFNLGDENAELISAKLIPLSTQIDESYAYSMLDSIASIDSGEEGDLTFTFDIKEEARGSIPAQLQLTYKEESVSGTNAEVTTKTLDMPLTLSDAPYLVITNVEQLSSFKPGTSENLLRMTIENQGEEKAREMRVRLYPDASYPFSFDKITQYVSATLEPGESTTVDIEIEVLKDAQIKDYSIPVELESIVGSARYERDDDVVVSIDSQPSKLFARPAFIILALVLIASGALAYRTYKQNK